MTLTRARWVGGAIAGAALAGCGLVLGFEDHTLLATGDEAGTGDAANEGSIDGAPDASACASPCGCFALPQTLATDQHDPRGLVVDATSLYWASSVDGTVVEVRKSGGAPITRMAGLDTPRGLAADPLALYYGSDTRGYCKPGIYRQPKQADAGTPIQECHDILSGIRGIAVDGVDVYWLSNTTWQAAFGSKDGSEAITPFFSGQGLSFLALNASNVFWTDSAAVYILAKGTTGDAGILYAAATTALAADDVSVYVGTASAVSKLPADGSSSTPVTIADKQNGPNAIALDEACLYWTNGGDGTIWAAPKAAGAPKRIANEQGSPQSIAVDANGVYWANGTGEIVRLAR